MQCNIHWNFFVPLFPYEFLYFLTCSCEGSLLGPHTELLHSPGMQELWFFLITETSLYFLKRQSLKGKVSSCLCCYILPFCPLSTPLDVGQIWTWRVAGVAQMSSGRTAEGSPLIPALSTGLQEETEMPFPSFLQLSALKVLYYPKLALSTYSYL